MVRYIVFETKYSRMDQMKFVEELQQQIILKVTFTKKNLTSQNVILYMPWKTDSVDSFYSRNLNRVYNFISHWLYIK